MSSKRGINEVGATASGGAGAKKPRKGVNQNWQAQEAARKLQENRRAPKEVGHQVRIRRVSTAAGTTVAIEPELRACPRMLSPRANTGEAQKHF